MDQTSSKPNQIQRIVLVVFAIAIGQLLINTGLLHHAIIHLDGAQEYREGAILDTTNLLIEGSHPYSLEQLPTHTNVYGVTLSFIMGTLNPIIEPSLENHRKAVGLLLILSCITIFSISRRSGLSVWLSSMAGILYYVLICLSYSVLARPDAAGLLFMLLTIRLVMENGKLGKALLVFSILSACIAFFTKPYFLFGAGCAAVYLGWNRGLKYAVGYWISLTVVLTLFLFVAKQQWPIYWFSTFEIHRLANSPSWDHFKSQWIFFLITHAGMLLSLLIVAPNLFKKESWKEFEWKTMISCCWSKGCGSIIPGNWAGVCSLSAFVALAASLAWHQGAYYIYFVHLLTPFLIIAALMAAKDISYIIKGSSQTYKLPLPAMAITIQVIILSIILRPLPVRDLENYLAWKSTLDPSEKILAPPLLIPELLEKGMDYPDNGQTEYFLACSLGFEKSTDENIVSASTDFLNTLRASVKEGYYDKIIMIPRFFSNHFSEELMIDKYEKTDSGYLYSYFGNFNKPWKYGIAGYQLELWERKTEGDTDIRMSSLKKD